MVGLVVSGRRPRWKAVPTVTNYWALAGLSSRQRRTTMGLLEKLRPQPKWKHADPAVRLDALQTIDDTDQESLVALATEDADARVRRAAASRVTVATTLAAIVRNESDPATRDHAAARL